MFGSSYTGGKPRSKWIVRTPGAGDYKQVNIQQIITDGADCYPWREVFAWRPVKTVRGQHVWGKKVFKRRVWIVWGTGFHMEPETQYATAFELLLMKDNDTYEL